MHLVLRPFIAAFVLTALLTTGLMVVQRGNHPAPQVMVLNRGHVHENDWRLYWFVPELDYLRPFTNPLYDVQVIGWWRDWLYFSGNTGWFEDTTANQLRNVYRVRAQQSTPEQVTRSIIRRGVIWLPDQDQMVYPAPSGRNRTDLFRLDLSNNHIKNLTHTLPNGINMRRIPLIRSADGLWVLPYAGNAENPSLYAVSTRGETLVEVGDLDQPVLAEFDSGTWSVFQVTDGLYRIGAAGDVRRFDHDTTNQPVVAWLGAQGVMVTQSVFGKAVIAYSLNDGVVLWRVDGQYLTHAPDGSVVYVMQAGGHTVQIGTQDGAAEPLAEAIAVVWGWTPDGDWLVYQNGAADVRRLHRDTQRTNLMRQFDGGYLYNVGPTPDGDEWLFSESTTAQTALKRIRLDGRDERHLMTIESRTPQPTTLFAGWTLPFEKAWSPPLLLGIALGAGAGMLRRRPRLGKRPNI